MVTRVRRARGFSLLELMVASLVALIILAGALAVLVQGGKLRRRQRDLGEMNREAALVLGQMASELRQAGLGRPRGPRFVDAATNAELFPASILDVTATRFVFLVDLPRPNSNFNGISYLTDHQPMESVGAGADDSKRLAVVNELNGGCDVTRFAPLFRCSTKNHSTILPASSTANTDCTSFPSNSASCPWALNKYQKNEFILVVDGAGRWVERQLGDPVYAVNTLNTRDTLALTTAVNPDLLKGIANRAFISTPDRVFYKLVQVTAGPPARFRLERKQCWGRLATSNTDPAVTFASASAECAAGVDGTPWEVLLRGLPSDGLTMTYRDGNGDDVGPHLTSTTPGARERALRSIRRVDIKLKLVRAPTGSQELEHTTTVSVNVRQ